ncbi:Maf family protein [Trichloromonas sp.]|uniref:Maf family protein n=1 Tax=Trichloromonas sp. TaxID=3069249 RepID=UPI002A3EF587|nr:Maf family protein [Trichloromonas sp.]
MRTLVLASTSPYRLQLLRQLGLPFQVAAPLFEERIDQDIAPDLLVRHLSLHKAKSLGERFPEALIIGADQVFTDPRGKVLGKPGSVEAAVAQLREMAGRSHTFYTGVTVYDSLSHEVLTDVVTFTVTLRHLNREQLVRYVKRENPVDCAGSFKIEGLGIALMERMEGSDYTALIGLPLIRLTAMLEQFGVEVL